MTKAILFDLDGTLINTAPDFVSIINTMRAERNLGPVDAVAFTAQIARGSAHMTQHGLNLTESSPDYQTSLECFYQRYLDSMGQHAELYPGIKNLIHTLESQNIPWGVVTNRKLAFIPQILKQFNLHDNAGCIVGSDSTPHRKPHPAPLLHAANTLGVNPENCLYVGDFPTDIEAGHAANMETVAVTWGYHDGIESLRATKPTYLFESPEEIQAIIKK